MSLVVVAGHAAAQSFLSLFIDPLVKRCVSYIGNPVPPEFTMMNRNHYVFDDRNGTILLITNENMVIESSLGCAADTTNEALEWLSYFYNYFEKYEWTYYLIDNIDTYENDGATAYLLPLQKRMDDYIVATIIFRK